MVERPWVTPEELKEYTEFEEVKNRADSKLKIDISRAESWVCLLYTSPSPRDS